MKRFIFCYEVRKNVEVVVDMDDPDEAERIADKEVAAIARDNRLLEKANSTVVELVYAEMSEE